MSKNPVINALSASAYITLVVSVLHFISQTQGSKPDTFFAPIVFLSLLTFSVTVMAYIFFYQPLQLFIQGKKKEAEKIYKEALSYDPTFKPALDALDRLNSKNK